MKLSDIQTERNARTVSVVGKIIDFVQLGDNLAFKIQSQTDSHGRYVVYNGPKIKPSYAINDGFLDKYKVDIGSLVYVSAQIKDSMQSAASDALKRQHKDATWLPLRYITALSSSFSTAELLTLTKTGRAITDIKAHIVDLTGCDYQIFDSADNKTTQHRFISAIKTLIDTDQDRFDAIRQGLMLVFKINDDHGKAHLLQNFIEFPSNFTGITSSDAIIDQLFRQTEFIDFEGKLKGGLEDILQENFHVALFLAKPATIYNLKYLSDKSSIILGFGTPGVSFNEPTLKQPHYTLGLNDINAAGLLTKRKAHPICGRDNEQHMLLIKDIVGWAQNRSNTFKSVIKKEINQLPGKTHFKD